MSSLKYELGGNGPHVVLLHPIGLDLSFLSPVARILRQEFTLLTLDQRGHGESRMSVPMSSLEDYADDLHKLVYEINSRRRQSLASRSTAWWQWCPR